MGSDNFCLRWNDFESNVSGSFRELREEEDFFDVTLGMLRKAGSHPNPMIYLRGISPNDFAAILDFIYNGEVNVAQEELNSFLSVAEDLQIKGLTQKASNEPSRKSGLKSKIPPAPSCSSSSSSSASASATKKRRVEPKSSNVEKSEEGGGEGGQEDDIKEIVDVKNEPMQDQSNVVANVVDNVEDEYDDEAYDDTYGGGGGADDGSYYDDSMVGLEGSAVVAPATASGGEITDNSKGVREPKSKSSKKQPRDSSSSSSVDEVIPGLDAAILSQMTKIDRFWTCNICGLQSRDKTDMRRHVEAKHIMHGGFHCGQCDYVSKTRHNLAKHRRKKHPPSLLPPPPPQSSSSPPPPPPMAPTSSQNTERDEEEEEEEPQQLLPFSMNFENQALIREQNNA